MRGIRQRGQNRRIAALKGRLMMRQGDLMRRIEKQETIEAPQNTPADIADQAVESSNTEIELRIAELRLGEVNRIEDALRRISDGTYGVCAWCGHRIPGSRLKLLPNATLCISCQKDAEREQLFGEQHSVAEWEGIPSSAEEEAPVGACDVGSKF